jgi:hypothetical protein
MAFSIQFCKWEASLSGRGSLPGHFHSEGKREPTLVIIEKSLDGQSASSGPIRQMEVPDGEKVARS